MREESVPGYGVSGQPALREWYAEKRPSGGRDQDVRVDSADVAHLPMRK